MSAKSKAVRAGKRASAVIMAATIVAAGIPPAESLAKTVKTAVSVTLKKGDSVSVTVKTKKKVRWNVVKGRKIVKIKTSGKKKKCNIRAVAAGSATVTAVYKGHKKTYKITVKARSKKKNTATEKTTTETAETTTGGGESTSSESGSSSGSSSSSKRKGADVSFTGTFSGKELGLPGINELAENVCRSVFGEKAVSDSTLSGSTKLNIAGYDTGIVLQEVYVNENIGTGLLSSRAMIAGRMGSEFTDYKSLLQKTKEAVEKAEFADGYVVTLTAEYGMNYFLLRTVEISGEKQTYSDVFLSGSICIMILMEDSTQEQAFLETVGLAE